MNTEPAMGADQPTTVVRMREGIRTTVVGWGRGVGQGFRRGGPWAIVGALAAGAIAPVVWPLAGVAGMSAAVLGALVGQVGNVGAGYLVEVVTRALDRARQAGAGEPSPVQVREVIEDELRVLTDGGQGAVVLRREVATLLRAVGGIDTAVNAAVQTGVEEIQQALFAAFADLGGSVAEFGWILAETRQALIRIQDEQARQGAEQRHQTDLARENLAKTNLIIQRLELFIGVPSREPAEEQTTGVADPASEQPAPGLCPYMGLRSFRAEDAQWFFGRERLTGDLVARLVEAPLLAVVGASGSGKSSLLGAGLLPAAWAGMIPRSRSWTTVVLTPTSHPLEELASRVALLRGLAAGGLLADLRTDPQNLRLAIRQVLADAPAGARLLVVIDQVEELFTLCGDDTERQGFLDALAALVTDPGCGATVVLGIRADFYARCTDYPPLAAALQDHQLLVTPMTTEELRTAITLPAQHAGLRLEPGLLETILADLGEEPGALPLLSHALLATWERRRGKTLTNAGYRDVGGVRQAIGQTADAVYMRLTPAQQLIAKDIFLRLTALGEGTEDTRRRVQRTELLSSPQTTQVQDVLHALATARLITLSQDSIEVAHEALIREWPRLREWLDEDRDGLRLARGLTTAAHDWATSGRDEGLLYRGARLATAHAWFQRARPRLSKVEEEFLTTSIRTQQRQEQAARRRTRGLAVALVLALLAGTAASYLYVAQRNQSRIAIANGLAAKSSALATKNPRASMLLAVEAFHYQPTPETSSALLSAQAQYLAGQLTSHAGFVFGVAFSPDGHTLATASADNTAKLWDVATHQLIATLTGHTSSVHGVAFSPDGHTLATASHDGTARLWDVATHQQIAALTGHTNFVINVAFRPDGRMLATASRDGTARLWDVATHQQIATLTGHTNTVEGVAFSPDGRILATASTDSTARLWDVATHQQIAALTSHTNGVYGVAFSPDGRTLATASADNTTKLWDVTTHQLIATLTGHTNAIIEVAFSPDGHTLATASEDNTAQLWNTDDRIFTPRPVAPILMMAFSPNGHTLATTSDNDTVPLWDTASGQLIATYTDHTGPINGMAFSPDGRTLATGGSDKTAKLWEVATHQQIATLTGHTNFVVDMAFSPDGHTLATSGNDKTAKLWDVTTHQLIATLTGHTNTVYEVAFSPDGRTLATASADNTAKLWDVATHQQIATLTGHTDAVEGVAFSPDGHTVATASNDRTARLWDVATRTPTAILTGHTDAVYWVEFSPDGHTLATASGDGTVRFWDPDIGRVNARLCRIIGTISPTQWDQLIPDLPYQPTCR